MINNQAARFRCAAVVLLLALAGTGCGGDEGPRKYDLTGQITHRGEPVLVGDIYFEPVEGLVNSQTATKAWIEDGEFSAQIVGGPHRISVRDFTGDPDMGIEKYANERARFLRQYSGPVEFPPIDSVKEGETITQDIEIPARHR